MDHPNSEPDRFLDEILDRALARFSRGIPCDAEEMASAQPHLLAQVEEQVRFARQLAVHHPAVLPKIAGYELLHEIGRGAFGIVYLARQHRLARSVALKVLSPALTPSTRERTRFALEARALARLRHPHIVPVYDVIESEDVCAYSMEWVEGESLAVWIELTRDRPVDVRWVCRLGVSVARALAAVHDAGLVHRDVKPGNIMLWRDGTPVLTDFGLVRDDEASMFTVSGQFVGTRAYAPPEQLLGAHEELDARADVYALGATLYHALARQRLAGEAIERVPLRRNHRAVPRDLQTIVEVAVDPDPARRYQSAGAMADDLERLLSLRPIAARRSSLARRAKRLLQRHRSRANWMLATAVLVAVAAVTIGWWLTERAALPARAEAQVRLARLALLDRPLGDVVNAVGYGGFPDDATIVALAAYDAALGFVPDHGYALRERAAVVAARRLRASSVGDRRMAFEGVRGDALTHGLLAYLLGDVDECLTAWRGSDLNPQQPHPLVDGALGELYLARAQPALALPRLLSAFRAFPTAGFFAVDVADAACRCGDVATAERFLELARDLGLKDTWSSDRRVQADVLAARGETARAEALYETLLVERSAPTIQEHLARLRLADGRPAEAVPLLGKLVDWSEAARYRALLLEALVPLWRRLTLREQAACLAEASATQRHSALADAVLARAPGQRDPQSRPTPLGTELDQLWAAHGIAGALFSTAVHRGSPVLSQLALLADSEVGRALLGWRVIAAPLVIDGAAVLVAAVQVQMQWWRQSMRTRSVPYPLIGHGCRGAAGVPRLEVSLGIDPRRLHVRLSGARPGARAVLLIGDPTAPIELDGGCFLHVAPVRASHVSFLSAAGRASRELALPAVAPGAPTATIAVQWLVFDPQGALGKVTALSAAAHVEVGRERASIVVPR